MSFSFFSRKMKSPLLTLYHSSKFQHKYTRTCPIHIQKLSSSLLKNKQCCSNLLNCKEYCSNSMNSNLQPHIENHLTLLTQYKFHKPSVEKMLATNKAWNEISPKDVKNTIDVLLSYGFSVNDIEDILESMPDVCLMENKELTGVLETWLTCQFSMDKLIDLFSAQPVLLKIDTTKISERIPTYLLIFNNNKNKLLFFLKICPEIMLDNFEEVIEKYNYVRHKMECKPNELLNSRVLCADLLFIKTRHMFLDRSGQFSYRTKHMSVLQDLRNPTLNSIFDTSDEMFAEKIARMSVLEYETFCSYYAQEVEDDSDLD